MIVQKMDSSLDIVNWFYRKAEDDKKIIDEKKVQHLLFLSQIHFALKNGCYLMPSLFVCEKTGFYEPTIRAILSFGLPLMPKNSVCAENSRFLELIWQKYSNKSENELSQFVMSLDCFKQSYRSEKDNVVDPINFVASFENSLQSQCNKQNKTKILISQNGPVKVSAWSPKKLKK
ncbi:MAG: hypothetical protein E7020_06055 [Alphaproteobacteria bacterium]|nr:hypothetical protein [Alphaproteobacteria bacterium]